MSTIQIETVTLQDGSKIDVIRDVEAVKTALAAAQDDSKRLDWLENPLNQQWLYGSFVLGGSSKAVRAAIDSARKEERK